MNKYVELYMQGMSMSKIAEELGCSRQNVHAHIQKEGIVLRPREKVVDHNGKEFKSEKEMCEYWGVKFATYRTRKDKKWTLEECLKGKQKSTGSTGKFVKDHKGNKFANEREMCEHWGVNHSTYRKRLSYGHSLEDALTGWVVDHVGNHYSSEEEMCEHWGVKFSTFQQRKYTYGYTLEECLVGRPRTRRKKIEMKGKED